LPQRIGISGNPFDLGRRLAVIKYSDLFAPIEATLRPLHGAAAKAALKQLLRVALGLGAALTELGG
jgi:hypothetical protein